MKNIIKRLIQTCLFLATSCWLLATISTPIFAQTSPPHPRLFFSESEIAGLRTKALDPNDGHSKIWTPIDTYIKNSPTPPVYIMPTTANLETYRNAGNILITYALAYIINRPLYPDSTQNPYFQILRNYLNTYAAWDHWGDESVVGGRDLGFHHMLVGNSIAYDWAYNDLLKYYPGELTTIQNNLKIRAEESYEASINHCVISAVNPTPTPCASNWWRQSYAQNHESTNHSALGLAALVLEGDDSRASTWLNDVVGHLTRDKYVLEGITDGTWHEGIPYQNYKFTMELPFLVNYRRLKEGLSGYVDIFPHMYLQNYIKWRLYNGLPGTDRHLMSFSNFRWDWANGYEAESLIWYMAHEYNNSTDPVVRQLAQNAQWYAWQMFNNPSDSPTIHSYVGRTPWLSLGFLYYDNSVQPLSPANTDLALNATFPDLQSVIWRTGWGANDLEFGFKGRTSGGNFISKLWMNKSYPFERSGAGLDVGHDHPDSGSFYLSRGKYDITSEYVMYGAEADQPYHNVLLVDGLGQNNYPYTIYPNVNSYLTNQTTTNNFSYLDADITQKYWTYQTPGNFYSPPDKQILTNYTRRILFVKPNYFVMIDDVKSDKPHRYDWQAYFTNSAITQEGNWVKGIGDGAQILGVKVLSPSPFTLDTGNITVTPTPAPTLQKYYAEIHPTADVANTRFVNFLYPTDNTGWNTKPDATLLTNNDQVTLVRVTANGNQDHLFTYNTNTEVTAGDYLFTGVGASIIKDSSGNLTQLFINNGTKLADTNGTRIIFQSITNTKIEAKFNGSALNITTDNAVNPNDFTIFAPGTDPGQVTLNGSNLLVTKNGNYINYYSLAPSPTYTTTPTPTPKPGDANGDGLVNGVDYNIWLTNYGKTNGTGPTFGDFNSDGLANGVDYNIWLNNYGK